MDSLDLRDCAPPDSRGRLSPRDRRYLIRCFLLVLAEGEHIPVRIFEPRNLVSAGRGPDSPFLILHERVFLESHTSLLQPADNGLDIADFPAQNGVLRRE